MLTDAKTMCFLATRDAAASRTFFETTLGLVLKADTSFALVFDAFGTELRVQKVPDFTAAPFTALGWQIADIEAAVDQLHAKGVSFSRYPGMEQDGRGVWCAPGGARVAWFKDPDGNTLSLSQL